MAVNGLSSLSLAIFHRGGGRSWPRGMVQLKVLNQVQLVASLFPVSSLRGVVAHTLNNIGLFAVSCWHGLGQYIAQREWFD